METAAVIVIVTIAFFSIALRIAESARRSISKKKKPDRGCAGCAVHGCGIQLNRMPQKQRCTSAE